jgi:hypothetical protein
MTRSGQGPRTSPALTRGAGSGPGSQNSSSDRDWGVRVVALGLLGHMLRSPRLYERLAFGAVVAAALAGMGQENRAKSFERLSAWVKRQDERVERKVKSALTEIEGHG